ncbi:hypothetical protein TNCV_3173961 [Trichonephila clavipes]|nr:hypothetical protein TNCV_3173961 [Trichonephila clavipes]
MKRWLPQAEGYYNNSADVYDGRLNACRKSRHVRLCKCVMNELWQNYTVVFSCITGGSGSRVVKISDSGWPCHEFESSNTKELPVGQRCTLNLSRAQTPFR